MSGNILLLLFSFFFICIITLYLYKKWPELDVIDLYIIFVGLHFGFSPFIRGLHFGSDVIFDFRNSSALVLGLVFIQIIIILITIRVLSFYFFPSFMQYLKLKYLILLWGQANKYIVFFIYFWLISFQFISYYKYGIITYITPDDFAKFGKDLPYWYTSMRTIYNWVAFCTFLSLFAYIVKSMNYHRYILIILTVIFVPIATIYGRRFFIEIIVASVVFWFVYRKENIFRLRYFTVGLVLIGAFFLFSNLFQAYRSIFQTVGTVEINKLANPFSAALDFNLTIQNLTKRPGTWEFNYLVINNQINRTGMTTNGKVNLEGLKSSIPRFFWPEKQFICIDDILAVLYNVNRKDIDIGKNLFGLGQVDFSYLSIIIVPLIILAIIYLLGFLIKITIPYPTFLWLISGNIIFFLINIEENGNEIFFMFRNTVILMILLAIYLLTCKLYWLLFNKYAKN
jgi:hypothetical protein